MDCNNSEFDSGGTSCEKKCSTTMFGSSYCICKTLGVCGAGSTGCGGRPCPQSIAPEPRQPQDLETEVERAFHQSILTEKIRRERELELEPSPKGIVVQRGFLAEVQARSEFAGMLIWGLMWEGALVPGHYQGLVSVSPASERLEEPVVSQSYHYTADIRSDGSSIEFEIELIGHPEISLLKGAILGSGRSGRLEVMNHSGWPRVWKF